MDGWREYLKLLESLGKVMEQLSEIEKEKTAAVSQGNLDGVDACMKREQALSMSLRGTDQKREKMLAQLGLQGVPLRELEDHAPDELRMEVKAAAEKLRGRYGVFQAASQVARDTLECHLRAIEKAQAQAGGVPEPEDRPRQSDFRI